METIQINVTEEMIRAGIEKSLTESLKSSYSNPVNDAVVAAIKQNEGAIKKVVDEIIAQAISNPEFKSKIADIVLTQMVNSAIGKR